MALWLCRGSKLPSTSLIIVLPVLVASGFRGAPNGTPDSASLPLLPAGDGDLRGKAEPGREELADPGLAEGGRADPGRCECAEPGREDAEDPGRLSRDERTEVWLNSGCSPGCTPDDPPKEG
mmetsp:Transcript_23625/g.45886  ORF Transcript_23625/g.45886 Transcript_23625/m.45886 type:complete len:122 (-) Transcript_23625:265-630(-)